MDAPTAGVPLFTPRRVFQPGTMLYGYCLEEEVGHGAHGVVFRARDSLNRLVALKLLPRAGEKLRKRLLREAQVMHQLDHHGIVHVQAAFVEGDPPCLVLDYIEGRSLSEVFADPASTLDQNLDYLEQVARAIHYAHLRNVIHRDLKPANVLVTGDRAKVTDFGIARDLTRETRLTETGARVGTPLYMAPEQMLGGHVGPPADIYALGVLVYQAVTGHAPFSASTVTELEERLNSSARPEPPSRLSEVAGPDHDTVCARALARDPDQRYPDALALARDLESLRLGEPLTSPAAHRWRLAAFCMLACSAVLLALVLQRPAPASPPSPAQSERVTGLAPTPTPTPTPTNALPLVLLRSVPRLSPKQLARGAWVTAARKKTWRPAVIVGDAGDAGYEVVYLDGATARCKPDALLPDLFQPGAEVFAQHENRPITAGKILKRRSEAIFVALMDERIWIPIHRLWIGPEQRVPPPHAGAQLERRSLFCLEEDGKSSYAVVEIEQRDRRSRVLYVDDGEIEWRTPDKFSALPPVDSQVVYQPYGSRSRVKATVLEHLPGVMRLRIPNGRQLWVANRQVRVRH